MANVLILDCEATCSDDGTIPRDYRVQEPIEIGALWASIGYGQVVQIAQFQSLICPYVSSDLTAFCERLTGIKTDWVERAPYLDGMWRSFHEFAMRGTDRDGLPAMWSWGNFDWNLLKHHSSQAELPWPFSRHVDVSKLFTKKYGKRRGSRKACEILGVKPHQPNHRALIDAKNVMLTLPYLDLSGEI